MGLRLHPRELAGSAILDRRFEEGALKLVAAPGEEVTVVCDCGRSHWLVTLSEREEGTLLVLRCHSCGTCHQLPYRGPVPGQG